ncbi:zinc-dependent alcohol dehydrogenase family protein [Angustibacter speluncae]
MRAVVFDEVGGPLQVREVPDPVCPPDGVVVRVGATGVCRSDWHAWRGHEEVPLPHVPGHELAGVVVEVGPRVAGWVVGQRVTAPFVCGCGRCAWCAAGEPQVCPDQTQPGFTAWGSFAELVALHAADLNLVALPDGLDDVAAASLGCRFATAYRAVAHHARVGEGEWLAVLGCGGVGLSAVSIGAALGARVVAVDVSADALARARDLGAQVGVEVGRSWSAEQVADAVVEVTGEGAHASVEALGSATLARASVLSLRRRGRHVQVGLLHGDEAAPPVPFDRVIAWELELFGSHGMAAADYPAMLDLVVSGRVDPAALVGRVVGLDEAGAALAAAERPGAGMTVVRVAP